MDGLFPSRSSLSSSIVTADVECAGVDARRRSVWAKDRLALGLLPAWPSAFLLTILLVSALPAPTLRAQSRHTIYLPSIQQFAPGPIRWVGGMGGSYDAVAVRGHAAYLGQGRRMIIVDLRDPKVHRRVGERGPFPDRLRDLAIDGGQAYLSLGSAGFRVMDLADPLAPREIGGWDTPGETRAVTIAGRTAYLADGPGGLRLLDVSDPARPRPMGSLDTIQEANSVAVRDGLAYVTVSDARSAGFLVVDVSDPARPRELGAVATPGGSLGVAVAGGFAYVADGPAGLSVVDVSDPARPRLVTTLAEAEVSSVVIRGASAFLAGAPGGRRSGVWLADLADPAAPVGKGAIPMDWGLMTDLALDGEKVYATSRQIGLASFEFDSRGNPVFRAGLDEMGLKAHAISVAGDYAYVLNREGLRVLAVSSPAVAREVGRWDEAFGDPAPGAVPVHGHHAYLVPPGKTTVYIVDLTQATAPRLAGRIDRKERLFRLAVAGGHAYLACEYGLRVFDLSEPTKPVEVGSLPVERGVNIVSLQGDRALLASSGSPILHAVDISRPDQPRLLGSLGGMGLVNGLAIAGDIAYVADALTGLRVVDVADPAHMRELAQLSLASEPRQFLVAGPLLYTVNDVDGWRVIDVSNPALPRVVVAIDTPGHAVGLAFAGDHALIADGIEGLQIYRLDASLLPTRGERMRGDQ